MYALMSLFAPNVPNVLVLNPSKYVPVDSGTNVF